MEDMFQLILKEIKGLREQVEENTQILKALEHAAQVNKSEHDNMVHQLSEISGEVKSIRKDLANVEVITASNWSDIAKLKSVK